MSATPAELAILGFGAGVGATLGVQTVIRERSKNEHLKNVPGGRFFFWGCAPILFALIGAVYSAFLWGMGLAIWEFGKWLFIKVLR